MQIQGGGVIIFGVKEETDQGFSCVGLDSIIDKADIFNETKAYFSTNLKYEIYDFAYTDSEYLALKGKMFQMMVVEDTPRYLPFISSREGSDIKKATIYIRKGTTCDVANEDDLEHILNRRVNYLYPNTGNPLTLEEHLDQLKELYDGINESKTIYETNGVFSGLQSIASYIQSITGPSRKVPNPLYPDESYDAFVNRMIEEKKKKIERVLDLY